jgi:predicted Zn-dependent peptidase
VTESEIRTAKEQLKGNLLLSTESTSSRMSKLAMNEIYFGRQLDIQDVIKEIDAVQEEEIMEISRMIFRSEFLNLTVLGDIDGESLSDVRLEP